MFEDEQIGDCDSGYTPCIDEPTDCCADTTSHLFEWTWDTLGYGGIIRSYLNDVSIIDENNIWVVGDIRKNHYDFYGAAFWNGEEWTLINLEYSDGPITPKGIWAFSNNDVWVVTGSIWHWNGEETTLVWQRDLTSSEVLTKIWARSPNDIYFVGWIGTIVHYNGQEFTRMESGTTLNLNDIYGNNEKVFVTGDNLSGQSVALEYNGDGWTTKFYSEHILPNENDFGLIYSTWCSQSNVYFPTKSGLLVENISSSNYELINPSDINNINYNNVKIRGQMENDIFLSNGDAELAHFNGITWKSLDIDNQIFGNLTLNKMAFKNDICVIVGNLGNKAIIIRGKRVD